VRLARLAASSNVRTCIDSPRSVFDPTQGKSQKNSAAKFRKIRR
jgi:hypothetical protein